jgi:MFS family permease
MAERSRNHDNPLSGSEASLSLDQPVEKDIQHNFTVNVADAAFFGFGALGVASFVTVIPLFISTLTESTVIIGLVATMHTLGWQLPQVFTSNWVAGLKRYKPFVLAMTVHERWPYIGLAAVALSIPLLGPTMALFLTMLLFSWSVLGAGMTATSWQSMLSKVMPTRMRGFFFGTQSAAANLAGAVGAVVGGALLAGIAYPTNFAVVFAIASIALGISYYFLSLTREDQHAVVGDVPGQARPRLLPKLRELWQRDGEYRWFIAFRLFAQVAMTVIAFFAVFALRRFETSEVTLGILTGLFLLAQVVANPLIGTIGDRIGHRRVLGSGAILLAVSAFVALFAQSEGWLVPVYLLAGVANSILWTSMIAYTVTFGATDERPYYIGLGNTVTAPITLLAPLVAGVVIDAFGFELLFVSTIVFALIAAGIAFWVMRTRTAALLIAEAQQDLVNRA